MPKSRSRWFLVGGIAFLALAVPLAISSLLFSKETEAWFDPGYGYRKRIDITNGSGSNLTDYQVKITFDSAALISAGKMQSDCDDIRVTGRNGQVLPYWIETGTNGCNTATTAVWIKTAALPSSGGTVYFYYGNSGAVSAQNGNEVFILFDDFSRDEGWLKIDGTLAYNSGEMTYTPGSGGTWKHNTTTTQDAITGQSSYVVEHRYKATSLAGGTVFRYVDDNNWWGLEIFSGVIKARGFVGGSDTSRPTASFGHSNNTYYNLKTSYDVSSHTYKVYVNDTLYITDTLSGAQQFATTNRVGVVDHAGYGPSTSDWVFVRKFATTDPGLSFASEEVAPGPIAHWKFDEGQGQTVNDSSGRGNNGTLGANSGSSTDDPVWVTEDQCISGKCLRFDGVDDLVGVGASTRYGSNQTEGAYTIEAWVKPTDVTRYNVVTQHIGGFDYFSAGVTGLAGGLRTMVKDQTNNVNFWPQTSAGVISANKWNHIVFIFEDGVGYKFYVNGQLLNDVANSNLHFGNYGATAGIGLGNDGNSYFGGFIDEMKVYQYVRTSAQIQQDYNQGVSSMGGSGFMSQGLVGYWKMDENSWNGTAGEVKDSSGNGNHGAASGGALIGAGKYGNGGTLDGSNDYVNVPDANTLDFGSSTDFTLVAWAKAVSVSNTPFIIDKRGTFGGTTGGYTLHLDASGRPILRLGNGSEVIAVVSGSSNTYTDGGWHFYTVSVSRTGQAQFFVDGTLIGSSAVNFSGSIDSAIRLALGTKDATAANALNGFIDEVRIYNRALSSNEVTTLYNYAPGPIARWNFDEGTGTSVADTSGGNNGVLTNGPTWTTGKLGKALTFDGTNDYTEHGDVLDMGVGDRTISFWLKTTLTGDLYALSKSRADSQDYRYAVGINTGRGKIFMKGSGGSDVMLIGSKVISDGNWHYMTYIFDRDQNASIYVDGQYDAQASISTWNGQDFQSNNPFRIGTYTASDNVGVYAPFNGSIDDVRIYNYIRTPAQIQEDMSGNVSLGVTGAALPDPVAHYKLDEQAGQTANNSGTGGSVLSGTLGANSSSSTDDPAWKASADCKINGCASFDGGDFVSFTNSPVIGNSTNFSISTWFKPSIVTGTQRVMYGEFAANDDDSRHQFGIYGTTSKLIFDQFPPSGGWIETPDPLMADTWYHVVYAQSGSNRKLYINGKLVSSDVAAETYSGVVPTLAYIGARRVNGSLTQNFIGLIDEFKIYTTALAPDQVLQDMNAGSAMDFGVRAAPRESLLIDGVGDAPVSLWTFDEKTGTAALDMSGSNNTANFNGGASWASGTCREGACVNLKAAQSQYVVSSQPISLGTSQTYEVWFKPNTSSPGNIMNMWSSASIGAHHHPLFYMDGTNLYGCLWNMGYTLINSSISPGNWYHAAMVYNSTNTTLYYYLNGSLVATDNTGGRSGTTTQFFSFGASETQACSIPGYTAAYFDGQIDKAIVYNAARTAAQVAYDYNGGKPVAHWKLDECEGTTIHDSSGNGLHGTLTVGGTGSQTSAGTCSVGNTAWGNGASGKYGASLNFDGTDDYASMGDDNRFTFSSDFSVAFWMKPKSGGTSFFWGGVSKAGTAGNREWEIGFDPTQSDAVRFLIGDNMGAWTTDVIRGAGLTRNEWHHVVGVVAGGQVKIYIDGKQSGANGSYPSTLKNTTSPVYVGGVSGYETQSSFNGPIDDVRIYNYALSPAQVAQAMNEGAAMRFGE